MTIAPNKSNKSKSGQQKVIPILDLLDFLRFCLKIEKSFTLAGSGVNLETLGEWSQ